jgi:thymidylate kinase
MTADARGELTPAGERRDIHPSHQAIFDILEAEHARWLLLRGESELASAGGEVDLLVDADDMTRVRATLALHSFVPLAAWGRGSHQPFLRYSAGDDAWTKLDIVTRLDFGRYAELETGHARAVLERRRLRDGLATLGPDDRFWALLLHCLLDRDSVDARHAATLQRYVTNADGTGPLADWFSRVAPAPWSVARVIASVRSAKWNELAELGRLLGRSAARRSAGPSGRRLRRRMARRLTKVRTAVMEPGISVALLGPDGAGKSTLIEGMRRSFYFPVRSVYMGLYGAGASRPPRNLAERLSRLWGGYVRAAYHRRRGRLVLFDRYGYDALLRQERRASWRHDVRRWLLGSVPAPDLVVVLDASAETLVGRKAEHDIDEIRAQRNAYLDLAERLGAEVISVESDAESVRRRLTGLIWDEYVERRTRRSRR